MKFVKMKMDVLQEFPPIGKYRIRLMGNRDPIHDDNFLEIREYVSCETFEGFTRRGVQIKGVQQVMLLQEILSQILRSCTKEQVPNPMVVSPKKNLHEQFVDKVMEAVELSKQLQSEGHEERLRTHQSQLDVYSELLKLTKKPKDPKVELFKEVMSMPDEVCLSCGVEGGKTFSGLQNQLCPACIRDGGVGYVFERGIYPHQTVLAEKIFMKQAEAIAFAKELGATHVYDCPEYRNPQTVYSTAGQCIPIYSPEERKEVQMMNCTLCQREVPAAGPQSGIGYKEETLCGVCLKAAQRVCPHALRKEDGVTCRDCGARPWSAGRVLKGTASFLVKAAAGIAKVFVIYTLQAVLGSAITLAFAYFAAKKLGFLP